MNIIKAGFHIEDQIDGVGICKKLERAGRTCYKSEGSITGTSYITFLKKIIESGHHSVLEHEKITVRFICDRGVSHELVRHRIASYSQESTRYCNYAKDKFGNQITVIRPCFWKDDDSSEYRLWEEAMNLAEKYYFELLGEPIRPERARSVLPNSLKTEIVVTYNVREWRLFFTLRTSERAHPQMREITIPLLDEFKRIIPVLFDDIVVTDKARDLGA